MPLVTVSKKKAEKYIQTSTRSNLSAPSNHHLLTLLLVQLTHLKIGSVCQAKHHRDLTSHSQFYCCCQAKGVTMDVDLASHSPGRFSQRQGARLGIRSARPMFVPYVNKETRKDISRKNKQEQTTTRRNTANNFTKQQA